MPSEPSERFEAFCGAPVTAQDGSEPQSAESAEVSTAADAAQQGGVHPQQGEMPFALVYGEAFTKLPQDLYILPDALEVIL